MRSITCQNAGGCLNFRANSETFGENFNFVQTIFFSISKIEASLNFRSKYIIQTSSIPYLYIHTELNSYRHAWCYNVFLSESSLRINIQTEFLGFKAKNTVLSELWTQKRLKTRFCLNFLWLVWTDVWKDVKYLPTKPVKNHRGASNWYIASNNSSLLLSNFGLRKETIYCLPPGLRWT